MEGRKEEIETELTTLPWFKVFQDLTWFVGAPPQLHVVVAGEQTTVLHHLLSEESDPLPTKYGEKRRKWVKRDKAHCWSLFSIPGPLEVCPLLCDEDKWLQYQRSHSQFQMATKLFGLHVKWPPVNHYCPIQIEDGVDEEPEDENNRVKKMEKQELE